MIEVGVALFDLSKPLENTCGVCISRSHSTSVSSVKDLPTNHIWLTNLPWEAHVGLIVGKNNHIKADSYFGIAFSELIAELAASALPTLDQATILANHARRTVRIAMTLLGSALGERLLTTDNFPAAIAKHFYPEMPPLNPPSELMSEIRSSTQRTVILNRIDAKQKDIVTLRVAPRAHAQAILATPAPLPNIIPNYTDTTLEADASIAKLSSVINESELPLLFGAESITLSKRAKSNVTLTACRSMWGQTKRWLTSIELVALDEIGTLVDINTMRVFDDPIKPSEVAAHFPRADQIDDIGDMSLACALFWNCYWLSMATDWHPAWHPPSSLWLRSSDRMRLYAMLAPLFAIKNLVVHEYGEGVVKVSGSEDALLDLIHEAPLRGLMPCPDLWALIPEDVRATLPLPYINDYSFKYACHLQRLSINDRWNAEEQIEALLCDEIASSPSARGKRFVTALQAIVQPTSHLIPIKNS